MTQASRFLLHIVPGNIHRVRYAGLFQAKGRTETLAQVRGLLETYYRLNPETLHPALKGIEQQPTSDLSWFTGKWNPIPQS